MFHEHNHLFFRHEAFEIFPRFVGVERLELRRRSIPHNTFGKRKQILHETFLAGELHLNWSIAKSTDATAEDILLMPLYCLVRIIKSNKLDICIHSLACHSLHYDVNGLIGVIKNFGVASQESNNFRSFRSERNLQAGLDNNPGPGTLKLTFFSFTTPWFVATA